MKNAPTNLDELLELLEKYDNGPDHICMGDVSEWEDHRATPPWDGAPMNHELDMTSLPTFGGTEPADTTGVWSWDETRMIVGDGSADLEIVERTFETPNLESDESIDSIMRNELSKEEN